MHHHVARAARGDLFRTWSEAHALWTRLLPRLGVPVAVCLMPNHVHVLHVRDVRRELRCAMSAYARWRNHQRGERGRRVWARAPAAEPLGPGAQKLRRSERYVHLNPCRARLVSDPLAWPFSTYLDAVGLALEPCRSADREPSRLHAYTSADPSVAVSGSLLPVAGDPVPSLDALLDATSHLARVPRDELGRHVLARSVAIRAARVTTATSTAELAAALGVSRSTVTRTAVFADDAVRRVERVAGDPRFGGLPWGPLPFR